MIVGDNSPTDISDVFELAPRTILWGADHLRQYLPKKGRFLVWDKLDGKDYDIAYSDAEFAFDTKPGQVIIFRQLWKGAITNKCSNEDSKRYHPNAKSIQLMEWCIQLAKLTPGDLVVDPYMGSATTAIACYRQGMRFIGCEIDPYWFKIAVRRVQKRCPKHPHPTLF